MRTLLLVVILFGILVSCVYGEYNSLFTDVSDTTFATTAFTDTFKMILFPMMTESLIWTLDTLDPLSNGGYAVPVPDSLITVPSYYDTIWLTGTTTPNGNSIGEYFND